MMMVLMMIGCCDGDSFIASWRRISLKGGGFFFFVRRCTGGIELCVYFELLLIVQDDQ